jgi:hypothetical protein
MTRALFVSLLCPILLAAGCAATGTPTPAAAPASGAAAMPEPPAEPRAVAVAAPPSIPVAPELAAAAKALDAEVHGYFAKGTPARRDGYVYSLDVAALMLYAARRGDGDLYAKLLPAAQSLVLQNPDDPYTHGFVLVRTKNGAKPDTSGAGDALWLARALWAGAAAFGRDEDRTLALAILDGYTKHTYVLQGVWLARRSFDFGSRSFVSLSTVPAYQPDFLAQAERSEGRSSWRGFAERSYSLLERTATPSGLLYPMIQPEVGATYPGAGLDVYAPNGLSPLEDSCLGAEGAVGGMPKLGTSLLDFSLQRAAKGTPLRAYYSIEDGAPAADAALSAGGTACLSRLASALGHAEALAVLDPRLTAELKAAANPKARGRLPGAGSLLLAAQARGAF